MSNGQNAERIVENLGKDFKLVGKSHVHAWYAWAIVGIVLGMALMVVYVANRSIRFDAGKASTNDLEPALPFAQLPPEPNFPEMPVVIPSPNPEPVSQRQDLAATISPNFSLLVSRFEQEVGPVRRVSIEQVMPVNGEDSSILFEAAERFSVINPENWSTVADRIRNALAAGFPIEVTLANTQNPSALARPYLLLDQRLHPQFITVLSKILDTDDPLSDSVAGNSKMCKCDKTSKAIFSMDDGSGSSKDINGIDESADPPFTYSENTNLSLGTAGGGGSSDDTIFSKIFNSKDACTTDAACKTHCDSLKVTIDNLIAQIDTSTKEGKAAKEKADKAKANVKTTYLSPIEGENNGKCQAMVKVE